jgi:hypothetical protein
MFVQVLEDGIALVHRHASLGVDEERELIFAAASQLGVRDSVGDVTTHLAR